MTVHAAPPYQPALLLSVLSPRTNRRPPLSPTPGAEDRKFDKDKSSRRPDLPSNSRGVSLSVPSRGPNPAANQRIAVNETKEEVLVEKDLLIIDWATFDQILELDEDDSLQFSQEMVQEFYTQAETTFEEMNGLFKDQELSALTEKSHFLMGSSAAIGLKEVHKSCQEIQGLGELYDENTGIAISREEALERLGKVLRRVRREYDEAKRCLDDYLHSKLEGRLA